jgi:hypothetical protein
MSLSGWRRAVRRSWSWVEDLSFCFMGFQGFHSLAATRTPRHHPCYSRGQQSKRGRFRISNQTEGSARRRLGEHHILWPSNTLRILDDFLFVARFNIHRFWILLLLSNAPVLSSPTIGRIGEGLIGGRAVNISSPRLENRSLWIGHPNGRRTERGAGLKHVR